MSKGDNGRVSLEEIEQHMLLMKRLGFRYLEVAGLKLSMDDILGDKASTSAIGFDSSTQQDLLNED